MKDSRFNRERVFRSFVSYMARGQGDDDDQGRQGNDAPNLRDLLSTMASWAGKGKDEIIQVLCREVGTAVAAMLKEPLQQLVQAQKLVVTIELSHKKTAPKTKVKIQRQRKSSKSR